ncbi:MAG: hypothetical protein IPK37_17735 [Austwickia sp.]|nr:MAG: hypothetical protein IPK37_17735 [Austwickia sp.]
MFWQLTIDTVDPERLAAFWAQALGWSGTPPAGDEPWQDHYRARRTTYVPSAAPGTGTKPTLR